MRLDNEILKFIKESKLSYSKILMEVKKRFNIKISKSLVCYYKRSKNREIIPKFNNLSEEDIEWLNGLFLADGCKFKEKNYLYTIKIALDKSKDKYVLKKLIQILNKLECKFSISVQGNSIILKTYSKKLFEKLPTKNIIFKPKDNYAFLAGLVDGDGYKKGGAAILVQYKNVDTMKNLSKSLRLKQRTFPVLTNFGPSIRREYYIPKYICELIRKKDLSIKLKNNI